MIQPDCLAIVTPAALSQKMLDAICNIKIKHPKFKKKKNTVILQVFPELSQSHTFIVKRNRKSKILSW